MTTSNTSDSLPTPMRRPTPAIAPRFTNALIARKSYPNGVNRYPSYFWFSWCTSLCFNSSLTSLYAPPCFSPLMALINSTGTSSWFFMPISTDTRTRHASFSM